MLVIFFFFFLFSGFFFFFSGEGGLAELDSGGGVKIKGVCSGGEEGRTLYISGTEKMSPDRGGGRKR